MLRRAETWLLSSLLTCFYFFFNDLSGNIKAISLCDIYFGATGQMPASQSLQRKDPVLEGLKKSNSSIIHINRYVGWVGGIATQRCGSGICSTGGHRTL